MSEKCRECGAPTHGGKPYCAEHIDMMPSLRALLRRVADQRPSTGWKEVQVAHLVQSALGRRGRVEELRELASCLLPSQRLTLELYLCWPRIVDIAVVLGCSKQTVSQSLWGRAGSAGTGIAARLARERVKREKEERKWARRKRRCGSCGSTRTITAQSSLRCRST